MDTKKLKLTVDIDGTKIAIPAPATHKVSWLLEEASSRNKKKNPNTTILQLTNQIGGELDENDDIGDILNDGDVVIAKTNSPSSQTTPMVVSTQTTSSNINPPVQTPRTETPLALKEPTTVQIVVPMEVNTGKQESNYVLYYRSIDDKTEIPISWLNPKSTMKELMNAILEASNKHKQQWRVLLYHPSYPLVVETETSLNRKTIFLFD
jgi:hypothetical protein